MDIINNTSTTNSTLQTDNCFSCEPIKLFGEMAEEFATNLARVLQEPMLILFYSLCGLWIVTVGYKMLFGHDWKNLFSNLIYIIITRVLLGLQGISLIEQVYSVSIEMLTNSSIVAFEVASREGLVPTHYTGLPALAYTGERAIMNVFYIAGNIIATTRLTAPFQWVYAIILIAPYFLLLVVYGSKVMISIFSLMMLATMSPFLIMSYAFNWGREMAKAGMKTVLGVIMNLFCCTTALGVSLYAVARIDLSSKDLSDFASITNLEFLMIVLMGWAGSAFQFLGNAIANSIVGTSFTNTAAGILTAGITGSAGAIGSVLGGKQLMNSVGDTANKVRAGAVTKGVGAFAKGASTIWEKYSATKESK